MGVGHGRDVVQEGEMAPCSQGPGKQAEQEAQRAGQKPGAPHAAWPSWGGRGA